MAVRVAEIMNRELFHVRSDESLDDALGYIVSLGITGAPVVDAEGRPVGMLSFRDAFPPAPGRSVAERMTQPVATVTGSTSIEEAGGLMAESGYHRLVVIDERGRAVGIVSALDVVRGLLGMPTRHPAQFPHYDEVSHLVWSDDAPLEAPQAEAAPDGAGVLLLVERERGASDRAVWVEATRNLRARLHDLVTQPQTANPALARVLDRPRLGFRLAKTEGLTHAQHVADELLRRAHGLGTAPRP